jgi:hypothetical protein
LWELALPAIDRRAVVSLIAGKAGSHRNWMHLQIADKKKPAV